MAGALWVFALLGLGGCAQISGLLDPARATPAGAEGDYAAGKRHLAAGRTGLAIRRLRAAVKTAPESLAALNALGAAYDRLGRHELAARAYARALAIDPRSAQTLNNIGYSYLMQDRLDLAVAFLRDANAERGGDPVIMGNRRVAEEALAKAGGPPPAHPLNRQAAGAARRAPADGFFRPRIERAGPGVQRLITRPRVSSLGPGRPVADARRLPEFLAAPMAGAPFMEPSLPGYLAAPMGLSAAGGMTWAVLSTKPVEDPARDPTPR